jgi:ribose transport system ATP-binding protein
VGAKAEIQSLINELAERGLGVLMISSELEELTEGSDRVVVLRDGQTVATLDHDQISQNSIMAAMAQSNEENINPLPTATSEDLLRSRGADLSRTDGLQPENFYPATPIASNDPPEGMHNQSHPYSKEVQHGQD